MVSNLRFPTFKKLLKTGIPVLSVAFFLSSCNSYETHRLAVSPAGDNTIVCISGNTVPPHGLCSLDSNAPESQKAPVDKDALPLMRPVPCGNSGHWLYLKQSSSSRIGLYSSAAPSIPKAEIRVSPYNLDVFVSEKRILFSVFMPGWFSTGHDYYIYDIGQESLIQVEIPDLDYPGTLNISQDGEKLLFSRGRGITVRDIKTGEEKTYCTETNYGSVPRFIAMSPDASFLCFRAGRVKNMNINHPDNDYTNIDKKNVLYDLRNSRGLFLLNLNSKDSALVKIAEESAAYPVFSPDSSKLAYTSAGHLCVYDIRNKQLAEKNPGELSGTAITGRSVFWFDSNRAAVTLTDKSPCDSIFVFDSAKSDVKIFPLSSPAY